MLIIHCRRDIPKSNPVSKRVEMDEQEPTPSQGSRPFNAFKKINQESPVKKTLLGQIHSVMVSI